MDSEHPYQPPQAPLDGPSASVAAENGSIPRGIVDALVKTRPWVLFIGIMVLLGCALMVMGGLFMMLIGGVAGVGDAGPMGAAGGMVIGVVYLVMAALYLVPGIHLIRYAGAIKAMTSNPTAGAVEKAIRHQFAFWRFVGIVTLAVIGLYVLIFVGVMIFAIASN